MTNNQLTEEELQTLIIELQQTAYRLNGTNSAYLMSDAIKPLRELQERRETEMDSEPVAFIFKHPAGRLFWSLTDESNKGHDDVMPVYAAPQPALIVEREPIAWLNDAYLARGVVDGEAGSEDVGPGYIPVYRHAQPEPVVPENCVTAEHRRVIEMLLNVCGVAFELADDSCQQDVDGEDCHVVPDDAFQKLSDALDEIENTLPTEDIDRPEVFLAWSAMPRAALKSLLQAQQAPVSPVCTCPSGDGSLRWPCPVHPGNSPAIPDGWTGNDKANAALMMLDRIETVDPVDDDRIDGIKRIVRDLAAATQSPGSEPATVPGKWIPVSERMPENKPGSYEYLVFEKLNNRVNHDYWNVPDAGDDTFTPFWNYYGEYVTHWMPLPAAPQEVKGD